MSWEHNSIFLLALWTLFCLHEGLLFWSRLCTLVFLRLYYWFLSHSPKLNPHFIPLCWLPNIHCWYHLVFSACHGWTWQLPGHLHLILPNSLNPECLKPHQHLPETWSPVTLSTSTPSPEMTRITLISTLSLGIWLMSCACCGKLRTSPDVIFCYLVRRICVATPPFYNPPTNFHGCV